MDNTVGEDWDNVELTLVAGAPHSFIQQLSEPYYSRRPVVLLPESMQLSPQTHAGTLSGGNGYLTGTITDQAGATIPGATVRLLDENGGVVATTSSDNAGNYSFSALAVGSYRVETERPGFKKSVVTDVNIGPGQNQMNSQLQVGTSSQIVEVTASVASVNTDSSEVSANVAALPNVANRPHVGAGSGSGYGNPAPPPPASSTALSGRNAYSFAALTPGIVDSAREMSSAAANAQDLGDLFEYKLKDRVTLKKNQSALVPIVQTDINAEKVSLWSGTSGSGRPLRALWVKNTSPLTLDGGSFSVLEKDVFAGEGLTDPIKPGENRLLSYATDLGLLVEASRNSEPQHVTHVKISKGVMTQSSELHERTLYTVRNQDDLPRALIIEHPAVTGTNLAKGTREPVERAPGTYRFKLDVPPKATASLPVEEIRLLQNSFVLTNLNDDQVAIFIKNGTVSPEMAAALKKIAAQKAIVTKLEEEMENRQKDIDRIVADQARLRENMKALKGSAEERALLQRYTRELDQQETQLDTLRKTIQDTEVQRDKADGALGDMIANLDLDASF